MTAALLPVPNDESRPLTLGAAGAGHVLSGTGSIGAIAAGDGERRFRRPYLVPVPDCEPPFDDEATRCPHHGRTDCGAVPEPMPRFEVRHGAWHAPGRSPADDRPIHRPVGGGPAAVATVPDATGEIRAARPAPTATPTSPPLGSAEHSARLLARALVEVLAGHRPLPQLRTFCTPAILAALDRRGRRPSPALPHVLSVRVCEPADGAAEVAVVYRRGDRVRMVAFRLERLADPSASDGGRWTITAVQPG